jgi:hypothetical protein
VTSASRTRSRTFADQGFVVLTALCEHAPFDLVGHRDAVFLLVSVKYRADEVDVVCIYCPDTGSCYCIDPKAFNTAVSLRVRPSRNNQALRVVPAEQFRTVPRR